MKLLFSVSRFSNLRSLNLADNNLRCFPVAVCKMKTLTELNLASNKIEDIPPTIVDLEKLVNTYPIPFPAFLKK